MTKAKKPLRFIGRPGKRGTPERAGDKRQAKDRISYLVRVGKLSPARNRACTYCGLMAADYHHYNGYGVGHHEDVAPSCRSCHNQRNGGGVYVPMETIPD